MYKVLASAAALSLLTIAAQAADLPVYEAAPEPMPVVEPVWTWSGLYGGLHAGYSFGESDTDIGVELDEFDGPLGGGQIGMNFQWNWAVLGIEADGSYSAAEDSVLGLAGAVPGELDLETEWMASVRGRLGVAFNRFMVYGTGGAAWAHIDADVFVAGVPGVVASDDQTHFGWVAGGGVEMMATQNITVGVEYLHYEFEDETYEDAGLGPAEIDYETDVIRGRVNFKFNGLFQ